MMYLILAIIQTSCQYFKETSNNLTHPCFRHCLLDFTTVKCLRKANHLVHSCVQLYWSQHTNEQQSIADCKLRGSLLAAASSSECWQRAVMPLTVSSLNAIQLGSWCLAANKRTRGSVKVELLELATISRRSRFTLACRQQTKINSNWLYSYNTTQHSLPAIKGVSGHCCSKMVRIPVELS